MRILPLTLLATIGLLFGCTKDSEDCPQADGTCGLCTPSLDLTAVDESDSEAWYPLPYPGSSTHDTADAIITKGHPDDIYYWVEDGDKLYLRYIPVCKFDLSGEFEAKDTVLMSFIYWDPGVSFIDTVKTQYRYIPASTTSCGVSPAKLEIDTDDTELNSTVLDAFFGCEIWKADLAQ